MAAISTAENQKLYFMNPWMDFFALGGISILVFLTLKFLPTGRGLNEVILFAGALTWLVNDPHFSMTNYRLYHSTANIRQFPITALVMPIIIILGIITSVQYPEAVAPYFVKVFILWSPYHFSGQSVGITMIYARRSGFQIGLWERRAFSCFIFMTFIANLVMYETGTGFSIEHFGIPYPVLGLPVWTVTVARTLLVLSGLAILFFVAKWSIKNKKLLPPIVLLPAVTHFVWFMGGAQLSSFDELVPLFHSLQYIFIAWAVQMKETVEQKQAKNPEFKANRFFISLSTAKWWGLNIAGGWFLFQGLPYVIPGYQASPLLVIGVVSAGAQIHHFFVDGVIWKLKNTSNVSPLMMHIPKLWGKEEEAAS